MERLTKRLSNGGVMHNCGKCSKVNEKDFCSEKKCATVILNRLAELEDKLESGELIEQLKGHWEDDNTKQTTFKCSNCGKEPMYAPHGKDGKAFVTLTDYCPHCGARLYWTDDEE